MRHRQNYQKMAVSNNPFAMDVLRGLLAENKFLLSKYFYDDRGSALFNEITRHPDYYLTDCELEILNNNKNFLSNLCKHEKFNLVELGPGEGIKAKIIINQFMVDSLDFTYFAIDISAKYLSQLVHQFKKEIPNIPIKTIESDYFEGLHWLHEHSDKKNMVLFLGSSIGNFHHRETLAFLKKLRQDLKVDDYLLIGFDLVKNTEVLMRAYDDRDGITKAFNLNLLERINRELDANFDLKSFNHCAKFNVQNSAMESFIISLKKQTVYSAVLNQTFNFRAFETIHVEYSHKYLQSQIENFAHKTGFEIMDNFTDSKGYFVNSLWRVC